MSGKNQPEELQVTPDGKIVIPFEPTRTEVRLRIFEALISCPVWHDRALIVPLGLYGLLMDITKLSTKVADRIMNDMPKQKEEK